MELALGAPAGASAAAPVGWRRAAVLRLDELPTELLARVLKELTVDDHARAACACRALRAAADLAWGVIDLRGLPRTVVERAVRAKLWKRRAHEVRELRLGQCQLLEFDLALSIAHHCRNANVTEFSVIHHIPDGHGRVPHFPDWDPLSNLPGPFEATINVDPRCGPPDWLLPRGLRSLVLVIDAEQSPEDLALPAMFANPALRELTVCTNDVLGFTDDMCAATAEGLATNTSLESFCLDEPLDQFGIDRFADVLSRNATLQTLQFRVLIEGYDWHGFADALRSNNSLRLLRIECDHGPRGNSLDADIFVAATRYNTEVTVNLECECYCAQRTRCGLASSTQIKNGIATLTR